MSYNRIMSEPENLEYLKCGKCGWLHFRVSRESAEQDVKRFNDYYDSLSPVDQEGNYGGRKSSIESYEKCFRCGSSHDQSVDVMASEVPNGSTIQPMIAAYDYPRIILNK